jgi:U6 snRNA-associated Sm-like protein LSm2
MLFFSFFKTLVSHEVTVELKNDISIRGTLKSVDQFLNIKLDDITVVDELKYPHLVSPSIHTGIEDTTLEKEGTKRYGETETPRLILLVIAYKQSSVKNVFIRGSVVRYVHLPAAAVDTPLLEDATRRGACVLVSLPARIDFLTYSLLPPPRRGLPDGVQSEVGPARTGQKMSARSRILEAHPTRWDRTTRGHGVAGLRWGALVGYHDLLESQSCRVLVACNVLDPCV